MINNSVLPKFSYITDERIGHIPLVVNDIVSQIRSLNPNKASGPDEISSQMLLLCDKTVTLPLRIIYSNILKTGTYPCMWKVANVTPVFKKQNKQLVKNYRPISKKLFLTIYIPILPQIILSSETKQVPVQVTQQPTNYWILSTLYIGLSKQHHL